MIEYFVYDVFTDTPFGGNQLAVFPDAQGLPEDKLQSIAAEFNFSEVTFVYPPTDPSHTARVRIFTPTSEVDFAGHPIIGTLIALSDIGHSSPMVLELGIGPLKGLVTEKGAAFTTSQDLDLLSYPNPALVAETLGLSQTLLKTDTHAPVQASMGLPFTFVELKTRDALASCDTNINAIRRANALYPSGLDFAVFAYVRDGGDIHSRMFAPMDNIPEDPATGSASATLAALLTKILESPQVLSFVQGEDMGRPSYIGAQSALDPLAVEISGQAVRTMVGKFIIKT